MKHLPAILFFCCAFGSGLCLADESADGHVLLRIQEIENESMARIDLTNVDTGSVVKIRSEKCASGGVDSYICLVPARPGRYFWTRFEIGHNLRGAASTIGVRRVRRTQPASADDTVEVVSDAINYVGDWELVNVRGWCNDFDCREHDVEINQDPKTLQAVYEHFPEATGQYEIYLSMLGKSAISLREFLELVEKQAE